MSNVVYASSSSSSSSFNSECPPLPSEDSSHEVLLKPTRELRVRHANVLAWEGLKIVLPREIRSLESKQVSGVPQRVFVCIDLLPRVRRVGSTPPLAVLRPHDSVLRSLHPHELGGLRKIGLVRRVHGGGVLVAPVRELRVRKVVGGVGEAWVAVVVRLEERVLEQRVVCRVAKDPV